MKALSERDMAAMRALCSDDLTIEMVGGAETEGWEKNRNFFKYAHMTMPALGFGDHPRWKTAAYGEEPLVLGFRTLDGVEGLNEAHRIEASEGKIQKIRCYCFCPETLAALAEELELKTIWRPYRSPAAWEVANSGFLLGDKHQTTYGSHNCNEQQDAVHQGNSFHSGI